MVSYEGRPAWNYARELQYETYPRTPQELLIQTSGANVMNLLQPLRHIVDAE